MNAGRQRLLERLEFLQDVQERLNDWIFLQDIQERRNDCRDVSLEKIGLRKAFGCSICTILP